jgi:hypothetical protein
MISESEYKLLVSIKLPVSLSVLGAINEMHPNCVMRQQGEHLLFLEPVGKKQ